MKRILVTGFGPYGNHKVNPTDQFVRHFTRPSVVGNHVFPTSYDSVRGDLPELLGRVGPDAVIALGLAPRAAEFKLENVARNECSSRNVDVNGMTLSGTIVKGDQATLASTLPLDDIALALSEIGVACVKSNDAGGYVCNYLFYLLQLHANRMGIKYSGFIHVPEPSLYRARHGTDLDLNAVMERICETVSTAFV